MDSNAQWLSKWIAAENTGSISCPACGSPFPIETAFDNAPRWCPTCKKQLVQWNFYSLVLTIDPEKAPPLIKNIIEFIGPMPDFEADEAMKELYRLFDRKSQ
ncbi:MAG: hypothetical protein WCJ09_01290 [Planctomycetota bacterium]